MVSPLGALPRRWWFPGLPGLRAASRTYGRFDLDDQPTVPPDPSLIWLEDEVVKPAWAINGPDDLPSCALTEPALDAFCDGLVVPSALRRFAARNDLQSRIRSATGCYLDLGDFRIPTSHPGGYLIHFLSDQQWIRHWMVYLDSSGDEGVVTSRFPLGFEDDGQIAGGPGSAITLAGRDSAGLELCADTVAEFLYRFWIENELFYALTSGSSMSRAQQDYATSLRVGGSREV